MKSRFKLLFTFSSIVFSSLVFSCSDNSGPVQVSSPDNRLIVDFSLDQAGRPGYSVTFGDQLVISRSSLGFLLKDAADLNQDFEITASSQSTFDETWEPLYGEFSQIRNHYNELVVRLKESGESGRMVHLVFRVFNDGIGFRYEVPEQPNITNVEIMSEETEFKFTGLFW